MVPNDPSSGMIKSDDTLFAIIDSLNELNEAGVTELANRLGLSKSTVHKHLKSMEEHDLVVKDSKGVYRLGFRFLTFGGGVRDSNELCELVAPKVKEITAETTETCAFAIEEHGYGVYTHLEWGEHHIPRTQPLGERFYLHMNSSGKAILAMLSEERIETIIEERGLPRQTSNTITDKDQLFKEIQRTRERGYAVNAEERFEGIRSIAAGIEHPRTGQIGSISMATPATRLQNQELQEKYANLLRSTINEIDLKFRFD